MSVTLTSSSLAPGAKLHLGDGGIPVVETFYLTASDTWYPVKLPAGFIGLRPVTSACRFAFHREAEPVAQVGGGLIADVWHEYRSPMPHLLYVSSQVDEVYIEVTASPGGPLEVCATRALEAVERIEKVFQSWARG